MPNLPPLTRRTALRVIALGAVGLVAGCRSAKRPAATPTPATSRASAPSASAAVTASARPALSPDELLAQRVAAAEQALLAAYDTATSDQPELAAQLAPFRADHAAHLHALVPGATSPPVPSPAVSSPAVSSVPPASVSATPSVNPSRSGSPSPSISISSAPPPNPILIGLAALERAAAAARVDDLATTTGSLARLLASIGGCEAAHAALLSAAT